MQRKTMRHQSRTWAGMSDEDALKARRAKQSLRKTRKQERQNRKVNRGR